MNDLISRLRRLESDHEPEGYPPVQMKDITALVDACEGLIARVVYGGKEKSDEVLEILNTYETKDGITVEVQG